jgi:hypothetical protein
MVIDIIIPWWRAAVPLPRRGQHQTDCSFCGREPFCRALQYISGARPGASGCLVRLADAPSRRRRSGAVIQSGAQLGALGPARIGGNRSRGRVATPCRQDRRSGKRRMGHRIRQRRSCGSRPPSLDRGRDRDQVGLIALVLCVFESKGPPITCAAHFNKSGSSCSPAGAARC